MDSSKKYVKETPEDKANIFSRLCFFWFLPFFRFTYTNDVQLKDIYNTSKSDLSAVWGDRLEKNWEKEVAKCSKENKKTPSLKKAIFNTFFLSYTISGLGIFFHYNVIKMIVPLVLAEYINYFNQTNEKRSDLGWLWASLVVLVTLIVVIVSHNWSLSALRVGMRVRVAVGSLMYRKLLRLNHSSLGKVAAGQLVNLLSNDVQRFDIAAQVLHYIWILPINAILSFYVMYRSVGVFAAAAGMGFIILESIPVQVYVTNLQGKLRYQIAVRTDKRLKLMNEITSGIQVIKMYAWEKPFEMMVKLSRKSEVSFIKKTSFINGALSAMSVFSERLSLYITVITFVLAGETVTGGIVFSMAQLLNTLQLIMTIQFPRALSFYAEARVSIKRIESFLLLEEIKRESISNSIEKSDELGEIILEDVTASWMPNPIVSTLVKINLSIKPGTLCCVVGNVGAGKSSVLQLLLKELPVTSGTMSVNGKISFASQEPWLFVSSVRKNILFGKPYVRQRYREVVRVCSLERDFKQFPYGDKTLVGERGVSLSGGQRARVNLARAIYTEADIYLLDDPLSAVDTKVARHLFDECIGNYLNGKTRILVTHQLQFMKKADIIVIINNGRIEKFGSFSEMTKNDLQVIQQEAHIEDKNEEKEHDKIKEMIISDKKLETFQSASSLGSIMMDPQETDELIEKGAIPTRTYVTYWRAGAGYFFMICILSLFLFGQIATNAADLWLMHWTNVEEHRLAKNYSNRTGIETNNALLSLLSQNVTETPLLSNTSLSEAITAAILLPSNRSLSEAVTAATLLLSEASLPEATTAATLSPSNRSLSQAVTAATLSPSNRSLSQAVTAATLLLSSASLPESIGVATTSLSNVSLIDAVTPLALVVMKNLTRLNATFNTLNETLEGEEEINDRNYYILVYSIFVFGSAILLTTRSFLYYHMCMQASKILHNRMFHCVLEAPMRFFDTNPSGRILNRFSKDMGALDEVLPRALLDSLQIFCVMAGILIMVFIISPWMLAPAILLGIIFYWIRVIYLMCAQGIKRLEGTTKAPVFSHVTATLNGISTIRSSNAEEMVTDEFDVLQDQHTSTWVSFLVSSVAFGFYLDIVSTTFLAILTYQFLIFDSESTLSSDVGLVISQSIILTGMLQHGVKQSAEAASNMVSVERVLQYTKLDKEGPFETLPGKKPPRDWPSKGKILFKDIYLRYAPDLPPVLTDINLDIVSGEKIGVVGRTGAGKSTMIASLFRLAPIDGTISIDGVNTADLGLLELRSNISIIPQEPTLFSASIRYNLDPFEKQSDELLWRALEDVELKSVVTDLNQPITEGGANFSAGQRQLICLARAIVKNNKILVMDEATANVDPKTDALIQRTIRARFEHCTVFTIAHRLNTIMDSDRVLVMESGQAMEFDHPFELLQNPDGYFSKMLKETGAAMEKSLREIARKAYEQKKKLRDEVIESKKDD